jgi:DNA-binding HxlR family transcriptional regulator
MRSYDEYCSVAKSLDVVGDRWTLLIVRELMLRGACRYTDLRNGLPGIASNLLADRLRDLEEAGVISREDAPPPIATTLFQLTPRGAELEPVLDGLFRWGMPLMAEQKSTEVVKSHWLAGALEAMLVDHQPEGPPATVVLEVGDEPITIELRDGAIEVRTGPAGQADAKLIGAPMLILGLLLGRVRAADPRTKAIEYEGDLAILDRFHSRPVAASAGLQPDSA